MSTVRGAQAYDLSESMTMPKFALAKFEREEFVRFWPQLGEMLDRLPHTWRNWTKDWIYEAAHENIIQVWGIGPPPNAIFIMITQILVYPNTRVLAVVWAAGTFTEDMLPLIESTFMNYAKLNGCTACEIRGRSGWRKALEKIGFKKEAEVFTRQLPNLRIN